jgi:hypothetical protein
MGVIGVATSARLPVGALGRTGLPIDKIAHLLLYGVLGWTIGRALWVSDYRTARAVWLALAAGLLFGGVDEWHQGSLLYRETSFADWLADAAGVSLGLAWPFICGRGGSAGTRTEGASRALARPGPLPVPA